jgi:hypothetical protein
MLDMISWESFTKQISNKGQVVLLAYIHTGTGFISQLSLLNEVSEKYGDGLRICVVRDDDREAVQSNLAIHGSPFFVAYYQGEEKGRILGEANWEKLKNLLTPLLTHNFSETRANILEDKNDSSH